MAWTDNDFATIYAFIRDAKCVFKECPEKAAEYGPLLVEDAERAYQALTKIADSVAAIR